jgi:hypothetical protein
VAGLLTLTAVAAGGALSAAAYLARRASATAEDPADDVEVIGVGAGTVTLRAAVATVAPGRYGLWLDGGEGHVRLGPVIDHDEQARTVTREVIAVDRGRLREGPARWNRYFHSGTPGTALGLPFTEVEVPSEVGPLPAWLIPPADGVPVRNTWAVLVHGRGADREECLRAVPVLHRLGFPSLVAGYRQDRAGRLTGAGRGADAEWLDVESAALRALESGARDLVLIGWTTGAAIVLETISRSWLADRVRAVILDAPRIGSRDALERRPWPVGGPPTRLDWVTRASELTLPMLLIDGEDRDGPAGTARRIAESRPDLVTEYTVPGAGDGTEWNLDPAGWDVVVARFLLRI